MSWTRNIFVGSPRLRSLVAAAALAGTSSIIAAAALSGCDKAGAGTAGAGMTAMPPAPVTVSRAMTADVPVYLDEIGKTAAFQSVTIMPQVAGQVVSIHFKDGDDLKKGQLLYCIDPRPFDAAVAQAQAALDQSRQQALLAQSNFDRVEKVKGTAAVSEQEYDQDKSQLGVAKAVAEAARAALDIAKLNRAYCEITSPLDGRAGQHMVDPGNIVKANEGAMLTIQQLDPIYADFTVTENDLQGVRRNMANGTLQTQVWLPEDQVATVAPALAAAPTAAPAAAAPATQPAEPGAAAAPSAAAGAAQAAPTPHVGELTFLDNAVQDGTGTVKLRATLPNADHHFWPGQFVRVRLVLKTQNDAVLVPAPAVQVGQQGSYVFVVKPDGTADLRPVGVGQRQGDMVVIERGVAAGENVVVTGHLSVAPGGKVMIIPTAGGPPAAGPTTMPVKQ